MKKAAAVLLAIIMLAALCACGGNITTETPTSQSGNATQNAGDNSTPAPGTDTDPTAEPGDQTTAEPQPVAGTEGLGYKDDGEGILITSLGDATAKEIVIPSHIDGKPVTAIDEEAFRGTDITSLTVPWTVKKIDEDAFANCTQLASVEFAEGLTGIYDSAFYGCTALKKLTLPSTLLSIGYYGFSDCTALEEVTVLGGNTIVGTRAFSGDAALKTVEFKGTAMYGYSVQGNAFDGCVSLTEVRFSEGLDTIGSWCFSGLSALKTVYLPKSVSKIEGCAFLRSGLEKVYYAGSEDDWKAINIKSSNDELTGAEIEYNYKGQ